MNELDELTVDSFDTFISINEAEDDNQMSMGTIEHSNVEKTFNIKITGITGSKILRFVNYWERKEFYYLKALRNKIIHTNYLELALDLEEGNISEEEYDEIIDNNPEKYVVDIDYIRDRDDIPVLHDIVKRLRSDFSVEDVSELFAVDVDDLHSKLIGR